MCRKSMFLPVRLTSLIVLLGGVGYGAELAPQDAGRPAFYVGVCAHFGQGKGIPPVNLELMKSAGINSLRDELSWGGVESTPGQYAISPVMAATFHRAAQLGIAPMLIFDYANHRYDQGDRPRSPNALEGYTRYAEFLVNHFGPSIDLYEVWNEYDIGIGMPPEFRKGGSPEDYLRMLKHVYPRLKKLSPDIAVVGGAMTPGGVRNGWLEDVVKLGALDFCDMLSIHTYNYGAKGAARTPEAWRQWMQEVQATLRKYNRGADVPLLVTEMGWPTHIGKPNSTSPQLSASYLGRLYLLARTLPFMRGVWWYDYQDDGWNAEYNEHNFGIIRPDATPKPSYYVMADVAELAARGEYLGRIETADPALWVLRFRLENEQVWAVWSADDQPRQILLETGVPNQALLIQPLGRRPIERRWGFRDWASRRRVTRPVANQAAIVVGHRPCLIRGAMDTVRLIGATEDLGAVGKTVVAE